MDKLEIAVEKINAIHMHGFGLGLTDEEMGLLDSDEVEVIGQARYGRIFGIKRSEG